MPPSTRTPPTRKNRLARSLPAALSAVCLLLTLTPGGLVATTMPTAGNLPPTETDQGGITLVGVQQRIAMGDEQSPVQVAKLWDRFQASPSLHYAVNWSAPVAIYALYAGFDTLEPDISLTIGYPESALLRPGQHPQWARRRIPDGRYVNYADDSSDAEAARELEGRVRSAWKKLDRNRLPTAILERYAIGPDGDITRADVLVLYR